MTTELTLTADGTFDFSRKLNHLTATERHQREFVDCYRLQAGYYQRLLDAARHTPVPPSSNQRNAYDSIRASLAGHARQRNNDAYQHQARLANTQAQIANLTERMQRYEPHLPCTITRKEFNRLAAKTPGFVRSGTLFQNTRLNTARISLRFHNVPIHAQPSHVNRFVYEPEDLKLINPDFRVNFYPATSLVEFSNVQRKEVYFVRGPLNDTTLLDHLLAGDITAFMSHLMSIIQAPDAWRPAVTFFYQYFHGEYGAVVIPTNYRRLRIERSPAKPDRYQLFVTNEDEMIRSNLTGPIDD